MNYIQSADGTLALRLEAHEAKLLGDMLYELVTTTRRWDRALSCDERALISSIRNAAATLNHE